MTGADNRFVSPRDVETLSFEWGTKWPSSPRSNGAQRMAVGISVLAPGRGHLRHNPPGSDETGWEPLRLLVTYAPAGPEEVLRDLPGCTIIPPASTPER